MLNQQTLVFQVWGELLSSFAPYNEQKDHSQIQKALMGVIAAIPHSNQRGPPLDKQQSDNYRLVKSQISSCCLRLFLAATDSSQELGKNRLPEVERHVNPCACQSTPLRAPGQLKP